MTKILGDRFVLLIIPFVKLCYEIMRNVLLIAVRSPCWFLRVTAISYWRQSW
jgi:hypothetical protein